MKRGVTMKRSTATVALIVGGLAMTASSAAAGFPALPVRCAPDAVVAGTLCLDKYEASVWRVPHPTTTNAILVRKIRMGLATRADLVAGGATQLGVADDDYAPCAHNGQNCANDIYAVSLPSEIPSAFVTWFQAQEACANSGKRLPTSAEWQVGANGTPDAGPDNGTTDCNTFGDEGATRTGSRSRCVSARGAFDMVGNLTEWVADWLPFSAFCPGWASFSNDQMCLAGADGARPSPGAVLRGGAFFNGPEAGPFSATEFAPFHLTSFAGFRCGR